MYLAKMICKLAYALFIFFCRTSWYLIRWCCYGPCMECDQGTRRLKGHKGEHYTEAGMP